MFGKKRIKEKKNLLIANMGDMVVIKNRAIIGNAILGAIVMIFSVIIMFLLKEAWDVPLFWVIFAFLFVGSVYSFAGIICGRIVLRSGTNLMTVYGPFKKEYSFAEINYIDVKSSRPTDGYITHTVMIYIGDGRKCIKIDTFSGEQADELVSLLRGMLDNGAMVFPEGKERFTNYEEKEEKKIFDFLKDILKKRNEEKTLPKAEEEKAENTENDKSDEVPKTEENTSEENADSEGSDEEKTEEKEPQLVGSDNAD